MFSIGAETTAVLMPKRLFLAVRSRSVRRQPEKLGRRWWKVWNELRPGDWCWQTRVVVDQVCQPHEWVVSGITARYREELCSSVLQSYTVYALRDPQPVKADKWRVLRTNDDSTKLLPCVKTTLLSKCPGHLDVGRTDIPRPHGTHFHQIWAFTASASVTYQ